MFYSKLKEREGKKKEKKTDFVKIISL